MEKFYSLRVEIKSRASAQKPVYEEEPVKERALWKRPRCFICAKQIWAYEW